METNQATINREGLDKASLILTVNGQTLELILTEDNPNNVKSVFNNLLTEIKTGLFNFELKDENSDLYHDICVEYLKQLNAELKSVHEEMKDYDLLDK